MKILALCMGYSAFLRNMCNMMILALCMGYSAFLRNMCNMMIVMMFGDSDKR